MRSVIESHRVVVCTGSGGVGKTTTSAALGVAAAKMGKRVLVLTIDPARRLSTSLGIAESAQEVRVPGQHYAGELWACTISPARIFAEYIERHSSSREAAQLLFDNPLYQQLATTLSGSQEFTSLAKLLDAATQGRYDLVVLDTPPAAHAVDFLRAPERLNAVFDAAIVSMFMGRTAGMGFVAAAWKRGVKLGLTALTFLTGSEFVAIFSAFFSAIDAIAPDIRQTNLDAHRLLLEPTTAFVLISSFDTAKMQEADAFRDELTASGYHLRKCIVNRAWPQWAPADAGTEAAVCKSLQARGESRLAALYADLSDYYLARRSRQSGLGDVLTVPEIAEELIGLQALEQLADRLVPALHATERRPHRETAAGLAMQPRE